MGSAFNFKGGNARTLPSIKSKARDSDLVFVDVAEQDIDGEATDQIAIESACPNDHRLAFKGCTVHVHAHLKAAVYGVELLEPLHLVTRVFTGRCIFWKTVVVQVDEASLALFSCILSCKITFSSFGVVEHNENLSTL